jgi:DNA replication protein DnaD
MEGWIKLHRKIQDHWIYQEKRKFSRYEAWLDMIMMANHKGNRFLHGSELVEVERGQFITSELKLMDRWDWGKNKLRLFLDLLEKDGMIIKKTDRKRTAITICNYGLYHDSETKDGPQTDQSRTDSGPSADTNKNVKNDKNEKENISTTTDEPKMTVMDSYTKAFGGLVMNGIIQGYVHEIKQKGYGDNFIIELFLETGESSTKPNYKLLKAIGDRWMAEGITSREEAKRKKNGGESHGGSAGISKHQGNSGSGYGGTDRKITSLDQTSRIREYSDEELAGLI